MKNVSKHLWAKLSCGFVAVLLLLTATAPMLCGCSKNYDYSTFTYADFEALRVSYFYEKDDTQYQFITSDEAMETGATANFPSAIFLYEDGSAFFAHYSPSLVGGFSQIYTDPDHYLLYAEFGTWSEDENGVLQMHFLRSPGKNEDGTYIVAEEDMTAEFVDGVATVMAQYGMYAPAAGSGDYCPMVCTKGEIVAPSVIEYFSYLENEYYG